MFGIILYVFKRLKCSMVVNTRKIKLKVEVREVSSNG